MPFASIRPVAAEDEQKDLFPRVGEAARGRVGRKLGPSVRLEEAQDRALSLGIEGIAPGQDIALDEPAVPFSRRRASPAGDIERDIDIHARTAAVGRGIFPVGGSRIDGGLLLAARRDDENGGQRHEGKPESFLLVHGEIDQMRFSTGGKNNQMAPGHRASRRP